MGALARTSVAVMLGLGLLLLALSRNIEHKSMSANESVAEGNLRNIFIAQQDFRDKHGCFAAKLTDLPNLVSQSPSYDYELSVVPNTSGCVAQYLATASPNQWQQTRGGRYFSIDENETLRYKSTQTSVYSPVLK